MDKVIKIKNKLLENLKNYDNLLDSRINLNKKLNSSGKNIFINIMFILCVLCPIITVLVFVIKGVLS